MPVQVSIWAMTGMAVQGQHALGMTIASQAAAACATLSALHGSSMVKCMRRRWLATLRNTPQNLQGACFKQCVAHPGYPRYRHSSCAAQPVYALREGDTPSAMSLHELPVVTQSACGRARILKAERVLVSGGLNAGFDHQHALYGMPVDLACWMTAVGSTRGACAHRRSACSEMPVDAASEMMAMSLLPSMKAAFSYRLTSFWATCATHTEGKFGGLIAAVHFSGLHWRSTSCACRPLSLSYAAQMWPQPPFIQRRNAPTCVSGSTVQVHERCTWDAARRHPVIAALHKLDAAALARH